MFRANSGVATWGMGPNLCSRQSRRGMKSVETVSSGDSGMQGYLGFGFLNNLDLE